MERRSLIETVERKHRVRLDADDPIFMLVTISEVMLAEAREKLAAVVTEATNQSSASSVQAEAAARATAEAIITQAGEWAGKQIRKAGEDAAKQIALEKQGVVEQAGAAARQIRVCVWIAYGAAAVNVCAVLAFLLFR